MAEKKGWLPLGVGVIALIVLVIVAAIVVSLTRHSPKAVTAALQGDKKEYVGSWKTKDPKRSADLEIDATGEMSYDESPELQAWRAAPPANYVADDFYIAAFEGDDVVVDSSLRIKVTSKPHLVGDHFEMTANDVEWVREP
jgi:hypothetical protein